MHPKLMWMAWWTLAAIGAGCAPVADSDAAEPTEAQVDSDLMGDQAHAAWESLVGAWAGADGVMVFTRTPEGSGHGFFGDEPAVCARTPCPPMRVEGAFTAGIRYVTLRTASQARRYSYQLHDDTLTLTSRGTARRFARAASYCRNATDALDVCRVQGLTQPRCPGRWTCSDDSTCHYVCGRSGGVGEPCTPRSDGSDCAAGLRCEPDAPGAAGTCRVVARDGELCGGAGPFPPVCADGYACTDNALPDQPSRCFATIPLPFCTRALCSSSQRCCESMRRCVSAGAPCPPAP